jgi:YHS domain-containing protein
VFEAAFLQDAPAAVRTVENVLVGPLIAVLSFVCSVGNMAAILWAGGISFAGVIAFIYADLITLPIILIYRKYYGNRFALKLTLLMLATMVIAALVVDLLFSALGLVPETRPSIESITERGIELNYTAALNLVFTLVGAALLWLTVRRGFTDPVCGMRVDRHQTPHQTRWQEQTVHYCSAGCKETFDADPTPTLTGCAGPWAGALGARSESAHDRRAPGPPPHRAAAGAAMRRRPARAVAAGAPRAARLDPSAQAAVSAATRS